MNTHPSRRPRRAHRPVAGTPALTAVAGAALLVAAGAVHAQQTQTVTVTGIRGAIESAISVKKNADQIVEAISAEDLGKLPDTSIAESIARLPGLAAQRASQDGRAREISIRGMAPDFGTTLLNGREQVSTGDSRGVEYDQYPSELVNAVKVYKTPDAGLVGQGLSGTVDIQTVRPLDLSSRAVAVNYRKQRTGVGAIAEGDGSRFSLSYVDQFADRTLGVALGFARLDETGATTSRTDNWGGGTYDTTADVGNNGCTVGTGGCVNVPYNGFGLFADQTTQTRDGAVAVLQFRPSKEFESRVDLFYSKFDQVKATKGFQMPLNDSWAGGTYDAPGHLISPVISGNDVTSGSFDNVRAVVRNDAESIHDKMLSAGWNNRFKLGDTWTLNADLSHSDVKRNSSVLEVYAGTPQSALGTATLDTVAFTNGAQFTPSLDYTDRSLVQITDVQGWGGGTASPQAGYSKLPKVHDEANALRLSARHDLADNPYLVGYELGVNYTDRKKSREFVEGRLVVAGDTTGLGATAIPGTSNLNVGGVTIPVFDPESLVGSSLSVVPKLHPDIFNKDWTVQEKVTTAFVRGDIDRELFGLPVRGNVGLQVVRAQQHSDAYNVQKDTDVCVSDQVCPAEGTSGGTTYTDVLPSLNLAFDLGRDQVLRLALARVMARPNLNDMRASFGFGADTNNGYVKGDAGNPNLEPFRATAVDVAYEKYFGTKAYVGAAAFYKDLSTYIVKQDVVYDFTPLLPPGYPLPDGVRPLGIVNQPINGHGGQIQGVELSASLPFSMLTPALDGFGIQVSYSYTDSSVKLPTAGVVVDGISTGNIPLPGLSKEVADFAIYFEKWGFSARIAARHRSDFVGEVADYAGDRRLTYIKAETVADLQLGYEIQSGPAKGLSFLFQANNITDAPYVRYRDVPSNEIERKKFGSTYLFGLNYKL